MGLGGGGEIEGGRWAWVGWGRVVVGKWRQLHLNINLKKWKMYVNIPNINHKVILTIILLITGLKCSGQ